MNRKMMTCILTLFFGLLAFSMAFGQSSQCYTWNSVSQSWVWNSACGQGPTSYLPPGTPTTPNLLWTTTGGWAASGPISAKSFSTFDAAVASAGVLTSELVLDKTLGMMNDVTIPATLTMTYKQGHPITLNSHTLTLAVAPDAGPFQIFSGSGTVTFPIGTVVRTSWFPTVEIANAAVGSQSITLFIDQPWTPTATTTFTVPVKKECGAPIINTSFHPVFTKPLDAPRCKQFTIAGFSFSYPSEVYPEWVTENTTPGTTDMSAAMTAVELALPSGDYGGGVISLAPRTYSITSWTPVRKNLTVRGSGQYGTILKCSAAGTGCLNLTNISRHRWSDLTIDGNGLTANAVKFAATVGNSCTDSIFTHVRFTGATTDTLNFVASGSGSPDDISHINFHHCAIRSDSPSNSNIRIAGANALDISVTGSSQIGGGTGSPYNIDLLAGQLSVTDTFLSGATLWDVKATTGQFTMYGGRSESAALFISSASDPSNDDKNARHIIKGVQVSTLTGQTVDSQTVTVFHAAGRTLMLEGNFFNQSVMVGADSGSKTAYMIANGNSFASTGRYYLHSGGYGQLWSVKSADGLYDATHPALDADGSFKDARISGATWGGTTPPTISGATPTVTANNTFLVTNSGATTMTTMSGYYNQVVRLVFTDGNTTVAETGDIRLSAAFTGSANDTLTLLYTGTLWVELGRSVNTN